MISVILPVYKDPLVHPTIDSLLENAEGEIEVIPVLDGYWDEFKNDPRIKVVHLGRNRGMREAINAGVAVAKGKYLMRTDCHSIFAKGYDKVLTETCKPNWIVTPRRYFLDSVKWKVMDIPYVDYEKLVIQKNKEGKEIKFSGQRWSSRTKERANIMLDETMAMQGSCWFMPREWWDKVIGELDSKNYGPLYQDSHEMVFKTWKAGGKLMLNKNTWHAHKHRSFSRTHNNGTKENPSNNEACWKYSLDLWRDYYINKIKPKWKI